MRKKGLTNSKNVAKLWVSVIIIAAMLVLTACGSGDKGNENGGQDAPVTPPASSNVETPSTSSGGYDYSQLPNVDLRVSDRFIFDLSPASVQENDPILAELNKRLNVNITLESTSDYLQGLNLMQAEEDVSDIVIDGYFVQEYTMTALKDDGLVDMGPLVAADPERYSTLHKLFNDPIWKFTNEIMFGDPDKNYAIWDSSGVQGPNQGMALYNGAYLQELNDGKAPETFDEFIDYLYKVKAEKPDVAPLSGRMDAGANLWIMLDSIFFRTHGVDPYSVEDWDGDGVYEETGTSDTAKEVWKKIAQLYEDGIIEKDVLTRTGDRISEGISNFVNGRYAVYLTNVPGTLGAGAEEMFGEWLKINPDAVFDVDFVVDKKPLEGPNGVANAKLAELQIADAATSISIDSKHPDRALDVLNYLLSNEGQILKWYGVEGLTYESIQEDGTVVGFDKKAFVDNVTQLYRPGLDRQEWTPFSIMVKQRFFQYDTEPDVMTAIQNSRSFNVEDLVANNPKAAEYGDNFTNAAKLMPIYEGFAEKIWYSDPELGAIDSKIYDIKNVWYMSFIARGTDYVESNWENFKKEVYDAGIQKLVDAKNEQAQILKGTLENLLQ